ncbi:MAG TPA: PEGA domain-containing protein [Polyangiaceae bacterium]|nr:PEGA domain-containing protein [Polyangiaceae bacterium]
MGIPGRVASASIAVVVAATLPAGNARAEGGGSTSAAQPAEFARMRYRQGVDAYRSGRYREAVDYFLEADTLAPNAALSFNIARAYEKLDDPAAALRWYRDYLRRAPDAKDRADTEKLIHGFEVRLQAKGVQQVSVTSTPAGSTVAIDARVVGTTPVTLELPPGPHQVELRHDGYENGATSIDLPADHAIDVDLALTATAAPVAASPAAAPPPAGTPVGTEPKKDSGASRFPFLPVGWTLVGVGGASLATSLAFEISRRGAESDAKHETTQIGYASKLDTMEGRQTAARVFLGVGAGLAIAGGVFVFLGSSHRGSEGAAVSAACVPGTCFSMVKGAF